MCEQCEQQGFSHAHTHTFFMAVKELLCDGFFGFVFPVPVEHQLTQCFINSLWCLSLVRHKTRIPIKAHRGILCESRQFAELDHWIMLSKNSAERNNLVQWERWPSFSQIFLAAFLYNPLHLWGQRNSECKVKTCSFVCVCVFLLHSENQNPHSTVEVRTFRLQKTV